jgi:hypothetical protein
MDSRGADLAQRFEQVSDDVITLVEGLNDADLARESVEEQWTLRALAGHLAAVFDAHVDWVPAIIAGGPLPEVTMDDIHRNNAKMAEKNARIGKDALLTMLRASQQRMLAVLTGLREGDPDRVATFSLFNGQDVSVRTLVELGLIAHTEEHLASMRAALETPAS